METITKYEVHLNINGNLYITSFNSRNEAKNHIEEDLQFFKENPQYRNVSHEIKEIQVEANPKKEIFEYFLNY